MDPFNACVRTLPYLQSPKHARQRVRGQQVQLAAARRQVHQIGGGQAKQLRGRHASYCQSQRVPKTTSYLLWKGLWRSTTREVQRMIAS